MPPTTTSRVTEIDVGTPPYAPDSWETFKFNFHGFEALSAKKGHVVKTSKFQCFGNDWHLNLYPGGDDDSATNDGMMSLFLFRSGGGGIAVQFKLSIQDTDGGKIIERQTDKHEFDDDDTPGFGWSKFTKRSRILDPLRNILVDGTLVVELQMKSLEKTSLPCKPFVPTNSCYEKMRALWSQNEEHKDVSFLFPKENSDQRSDEPPPKLYAHRALLQVFAPGLFELCDQYDKTIPVPLTNIDSEIFGLILSYVYGMDITAEDWKAHSQDLIDAADRYNVPDLKLEAEAWYVKFTDITSDNVINLLLYADAKNCALLKESVMDYFVKNGKEALEQVSFDEIPVSRSLFTDLLLAMSVKNESSEDGCNYKVMRISSLRKELDGLGLDTDGSRETLMKRLEDEDEEEEDELE